MTLPAEWLILRVMGCGHLDRVKLSTPANAVCGNCSVMLANEHRNQEVIYETWGGLDIAPEMVRRGYQAGSRPQCACLACVARRLKALASTPDTASATSPDQLAPGPAAQT